MVGMVDSEHVVFVGRDPEKIGEATEVNEADRLEWVPPVIDIEPDRGREDLELWLASCAAAADDFERLAQAAYLRSSPTSHSGGSASGMSARPTLSTESAETVRIFWSSRMNSY
jgi:hypothetical protein